jgi:uncharacterized DUF497 family protein
MSGDQTKSPFERIRAFEWDEKKRASNLRKHGIDFFDVRSIFDNNIVVSRSDRRSEKRYIIFGVVAREVIAAVCTIRKDRCRWISVRRASSNERQRYHSSFQARSAKR